MSEQEWKPCEHPCDCSGACKDDGLRSATAGVTTNQGDAQGAGTDESLAVAVDRTVQIFDMALSVYTLAGVRVWLTGKNKSLGGESPLDLMKRGEFDRVRAELDGLAEGVFV